MGTALTALVERFAKLHPPEDLALLRVAQVAVKTVPQPLAIEHFARLRWKRSVRVPGAVLSGLFQAEKVNFFHLGTARQAERGRTIWNSPRMNLHTNIASVHVFLGDNNYGASQFEALWFVNPRSSTDVPFDRAHPLFAVRTVPDISRHEVSFCERRRELRVRLDFVGGPRLVKASREGRAPFGPDDRFRLDGGVPQVFGHRGVRVEEDLGDVHVAEEGFDETGGLVFGPLRGSVQGIGSEGGRSVDEESTATETHDDVSLVIWAEVDHIRLEHGVDFYSARERRGNSSAGSFPCSSLAREDAPATVFVPNSSSGRTCSPG